MSRKRTGRPGRVLTTVAVALLLSGCGADASASSPVTIGLVASLSGVSRSVGQDTVDGFMLYVHAHDGRLGGHPANVVVVDEGDGGPGPTAAVGKLITTEHAVAITGVTHAETATALLPLLRQNRVALVSSADRPNVDDASLLWSTSFLPEEPGRALAEYLHETVNGPVWAMASDDQSGRDDISGLSAALTAEGDQLANHGQPVYTAGTTDFLPFLTEAKASGAKAVYGFYAGNEAVGFVQQYAQSDARDLPLFAAGVLTEGSVLPAEGRAALGVRTVLNYAPDIDNAANRAFVDAWLTQHTSLPTAYAMAAWDAALVLDKAISAAGTNVTGEAVNAAIGGLGQIDSPRGSWEFSSRHSPVQKWYLRQVQTDGRTLTNSLIQVLDVLGS